MIPSASDWLLGFQRPDWLRSVNIDAEELAQDSARRFGGDASLYLPLHGWFLATSSWCDGIEHLLFRHHSFGVFEAETRFGPVLQSDSGTTVPTRIVAERHVQTVVGSIPPAIDVLRRIKAERWMLQATSPRKLGLD
ncbi:DUF6915 family protein [Aminobacter aganoensis]|uniref:DUF6915 domain-containing protein n=1 Tax=Aminobacter aganoensis TaxID=83264 RepID=A0A7X0KM42_9HYPH|nr:hypothetical protein [Aminobacter aganoensis]MBB6355740.1 hypothetical protein [Aminobacter aganoensis]